MQSPTSIFISIKYQCMISKKFGIPISTEILQFTKIKCICMLFVCIFAQILNSFSLHLPIYKLIKSHICSALRIEPFSPPPLGPEKTLYS